MICWSHPEPGGVWEPGAEKEEKKCEMGKGSKKFISRGRFVDAVISEAGVRRMLKVNVACDP